MSHPYANLPAEAFWRSAIAETSPLELEGIYRPRFEIAPETRIMAAGSCFAQHIGRQFKRRRYSFLDVEPPPPFLSEARQHAYGYDLYSARYGNIYSIRQMRQLLERAEGQFSPVEQVWENDGRFYDPFRPNIEPQGLDSADEVLRLAAAHLASVRELVRQAELLVFTFGLTEGWVHREDGSVYPTCPGTVAGTFDPEKYEFHNFTFSEVLEDARAVIGMLREHNPDLKVLVTVSPVPLTATATGGHVLPATVYSKSVLRAVCGELYATDENLDYFPSYELVASHPMRAMFFEPNLRSVAPAGVQQVMGYFFSAHGAPAKTGGARRKKRRKKQETGLRAQVPATDDDVVCEEGLLEEYAQ
jgi:hypothetical protein